MKELRSRLLGTAYEFVFKEPMSDGVRKYFVDTTHVGTRTVFSALITIVFTIAAARILGPANFGSYTLVVAIANILNLSMTVGFAGTIKYAVEANDEALRNNILSTSGIQVTLFTIVSLIGYVLFSSRLSAIFGVPVAIFLFSIAYAVTGTLCIWTLNSLRIFFKMKAYGFYYALQSAIALAAFLALSHFGGRSWQSAALAVMISFVATGVAIILLFLRPHITFHFDRSWAKKLRIYYAALLPGLVAVSLMPVDRFLINALSTAANVGIYAAYYMPSIAAIDVAYTFLSATLFPYASKSRNRLGIFHRISKVVPYGACVTLPTLFLLQLVAFVIYGHEYVFSAEIAFFFALAATARLPYYLYSLLIAIEGVKGATINSISSIIAVIVLVSFDVVLIPMAGILGASVGLVFAYLVPTIYLIARRRILQAPPEQ